MKYISRVTSTYTINQNTYYGIYAVILEVPRIALIDLGINKTNHPDGTMADYKGGFSADRTSAPDLEIFGDQVTLHPSGYVKPAENKVEKEKALMENSGRFRKAPLE